MSRRYTGRSSVHRGPPTYKHGVWNGFTHWTMLTPLWLYILHMLEYRMATPMAQVDIATTMTVVAALFWKLALLSDYMIKLQRKEKKTSVLEMQIRSERINHDQHIARMYREIDHLTAYRDAYVSKALAEAKKEAASS